MSVTDTPKAGGVAEALDDNDKVLIPRHTARRLTSYLDDIAAHRPRLNPVGETNNLREAMNAPAARAPSPAPLATGGEVELKTWPDYYAAVESGAKTFEVRRDDRPFEVGCTLLLREWNPRPGVYTGRSLRRVVTYVLRDAEPFGVAKGFVVLGLATSPTRVGDGELRKDAASVATTLSLWAKTRLNANGLVEINPTRLEQMAQYLAEAALRASDAGGGEPDENAVEVSLRALVGPGHIDTQQRGNAFALVRGYLAALRDASPPPAAGGRGDEGVKPYPKNGTPFYVNTREVWRWLPYKPDGARQMKKPGRWQRYKEYGFENAELPDGLTWESVDAPAAARTQDGEDDG